MTPVAMARVCLNPFGHHSDFKKRRHHGKAYLKSNVLYYSNGTSTFQLNRVILCGDIHTNPGPVNKRTPKYPCMECGKSVRNNEDAILCAECNYWSHAKCIPMSKAAFKYYWDNPDIEWTCSLCALPMRAGQYLFDSSPIGRAAHVENNIATPSTQCCLHSDDEDELGDDYLTNFAKELSTAPIKILGLPTSTSVA